MFDVRKILLVSIWPLVSYAGSQSPAFDIYSHWIEQVQSRNIQTLDAAVVELMNLKDRPKFEGLLMKKSRSLQRATLESPRFIGFTFDGSLRDSLGTPVWSSKAPFGPDSYQAFYFAFTGPRDDSNSESIEIIQENSDQTGFDFKRVIFDKDGHMAPRFFDGADGHDTAPRNCISCHAGHPIFDIYPFWPGSFEEHQYRSTAEVEVAKKFHANSSNLLRYSAIASLVKTQSGGPSRSAEALGVAIHTQQVKHLGQALEAHPDIFLFRPAILGAIASCQNLENFIPAAIPRGERTLGQLKFEVDLLSRKYRAEIDERFELPTAKKDASSFVDQTASLRWVIEGFMKIDLSKSSMALSADVDSPYYEFWEGQRALIDLARAPFLQELGADTLINSYDYSSIEEFFAANTGASPLCANLEEASLTLPWEILLDRRQE
jgi:hypothetical protein